MRRIGDENLEEYSDDNFDKYVLKYLYVNICQGEMWKFQSDGMIVFGVGDIFFNKDKLVYVFFIYCVQEGFISYIIKSYKKYTVGCKGEKCIWRFYCFIYSDGRIWVVKVLIEEYEECVRVEKNRMVRYKWIV